MSAEMQMDNRTRDLLLKIVDNHPDIHPVALRLHFLFDHFPPDKLNTALMWLINNRYTGFSFVSWFKSECKNSDLEMHRLLLSIVDNLQLGRVVAGKNFKI